MSAFRIETMNKDNANSINQMHLSYYTIKKRYSISGGVFNGSVGVYKMRRSSYKEDTRRVSELGIEQLQSVCGAYHVCRCLELRCQQECSPLE